MSIIHNALKKAQEQMQKQSDDNQAGSQSSQNNSQASNNTDNNKPRKFDPSGLTQEDTSPVSDTPSNDNTQEGLKPSPTNNNNAKASSEPAPSNNNEESTPEPEEPKQELEEKLEEVEIHTTPIVPPQPDPEPTNDADTQESVGDGLQPSQEEPNETPKTPLASELQMEVVKTSTFEPKSKPKPEPEQPIAEQIKPAETTESQSIAIPTATHNPKVPTKPRPASKKWMGIVIGLCFVSAIFLFLVVTKKAKKANTPSANTAAVTVTPTVAQPKPATAKVTGTTIASIDQIKNKLSGEQSTANPASSFTSLNLDINGVMMMDGRNVALINGEPYTEGDSIMGFDIIRVESNSVTIDQGGKQITYYAN